MPTLLGDQQSPEFKRSLQNQSVATRYVSTKVLNPKTRKHVVHSITIIPRNAEDTEIEYANKVLDYFLDSVGMKRENL